MGTVVRFLCLAIVTACTLSATPCGTLASPTTCSATDGSITYTLTDFLFSNANSGGGEPLPLATDVGIDVGFNSNGTFQATFLALPGSLAIGSGQFSSFTVQYTLAVSSILGQTVAFDSPSLVLLTKEVLRTVSGGGSGEGPQTEIVRVPSATATGGGAISVQMVLSGSPEVTCTANYDTQGHSAGSCGAVPGGVSTSMLVINNVNLSAPPSTMGGGGQQDTGGGTVSLESFRNLIPVQTSPGGSTPGSSVPEPASLALMGLGLGAIVSLRRARR